ncbi:MAG: O-antigen ligase family protein [Phycisphaerales bacterium]|nr:O-antigen ligase family protein [Phycisphaerales bacterium]
MNDESRLGVVLRWAGALLVVAGALTRASAGLEAFPYWSQDPTIVAAPMTSLGPTGSLLADSVILLGAGLGMLGEARGRRGAVLWMWLLAACGAARVLLYARPELELDDARIGVTWLAAVVGGVALAHLGRDAAMRRVLVAALLGFVAMLAVKGGLQVFIEHPQTVSDYQTNKPAFLAASGWSEGSPMARAFERRLMQPEASGWFGLANVYASVAAWSFVALAGLTALGWWATRPARQLIADGLVGVVALGAVAAGAAVVMAGSKGGYAAALLGAGLLAGTWVVARRDPGVRPWVGGVLGVGVVAAALSAVVVRGLLGERLHDTSILFRWFYLEGAARAFVAHPWMGTDPDGFKQAYMLLKPALSPENVESPHSILFDFSARLGVPGIGWCGVFLGLVWACGRALVGAAPPPALGRGRAGSTILAPEPAGNVSNERIERWSIIALASVPTLLGAWIESAATTPDSAIARGVGLLAWIALSLCVLAVLKTSAWAGRVTAAAALALAAHAQIEMTGVFVGSAALFFAVLGLAASPALADRIAHRKSAAMAGAACVAGVALVSVFVTAKVWRWESLLREAAELVAPLAEFRARVELVASGNGSGDTMERIAADLASVSRGAPAKDQAEFERSLALFARDRIEEAVHRLSRGSEMVWPHQSTAQAVSRLWLSWVTLIHEHDLQGLADVIRLPYAGVAWAAAEATSTASAWGWAGTVEEVRAAFSGEATGRLTPPHEERLRSAVEAWTRAAELDPHGTTFPLKVMDAELELGNRAAAAAWAKRVLALNKNLRLDPLVQLTPEEGARVERVAGEHN